MVARRVVAAPRVARQVVAVPKREPLLAVALTVVRPVVVAPRVAQPVRRVLAELLARR
jgi:hypothetical protein